MESRKEKYIDYRNEIKNSSSLETIKAKIIKERNNEKNNVNIASSLNKTKTRKDDKLYHVYNKRRTIKIIFYCFISLLLIVIIFLVIYFIIRGING